MSSAPDTTTKEYEPHSDEYDDDEAARHTEEFLANLMYQSTVEDGYASAGDDTVHVTANMVSEVDLWFTAAASEQPAHAPPARTSA